MDPDNFYDTQDLRAELGDLVQRFAGAPDEKWSSEQITRLLSELLKDTQPAGEIERLVPTAGARPVIITLPYPLSANRYWRPVPIGKHITIVPTKEAKAYKAEISILCKSMGIRKLITGRVRIDVQLYPNRPKDWEKRMRLHGAAWDDTVMCIDLDNANKVLLDAFKGVVIEDDKWVRKIVAERMEPDERGARVVVTITQLSVEQPQAALFEEATA